MPRVHSRSPRPRRTPAIAVAITGTLAAVLWCAALWQLGTSLSHTVSDSVRVVSGSVVECSGAPLGPGCTVRYPDEAGHVLTRAVDRPGIVGVAPGDVVPLWVAEDGSVGVAGWRPWTDAALLAGFAVAVTMGAVRWFGDVLRSGDALTYFDLSEDAAADPSSSGAEGHIRDVG